MPIAFYGHRADAPHWDAQWQRDTVDRLLAVAEHDPLSGFLIAALPRSGIVFEGGCGLGQYVEYLRRRGYDVIGGDLSVRALLQHRRDYRESRLVATDLRALPFAAGVMAAHISLGVVEHVEEGPDAILDEIARTLHPQGVALIAVPWVNGIRWTLRRLIDRRERRKRDAGMPFYQYAYTRREMRACLARAGLQVVRFQPYNPGRLIRHLVAARIGSRRGDLWPGVRRSPWRALAYRPPFLTLAAHMILAIAIKR